MKIEIDVSRRALILALGTGSLGMTGIAVCGESMTLATHFPSPAGIYQRLVSTGATLLARDGGKVGIGTSSPQAELDVARGTILVPRNASDPGEGLAEGMVYYNTASRRFRGYEGAGWRDLAGGGAPVFKVIQRTGSLDADTQVAHGLDLARYRVYAMVAGLGINKNTGSGAWDVRVRIRNYASADGEIDEAKVKIDVMSNTHAEPYGFSLLIIGVPR